MLLELAMIGAAKDETIRYGGCYVIGMAYAATGNNDAIARLLHQAVSDVPSDVQRAAVTNICFVLCNPQKIVQLLPNSYNSYIPYGAAALEVAGATEGNGDAIKILKTLLKDTVSHARQPGLVSSGQLLMNENCITMFKLHLQGLKLFKCMKMINTTIIEDVG